jgi:regulator-associated protein of mTOR
MWQAWDMAAEMCLMQLPTLLSDPNAEFTPSSFFSEQVSHQGGAGSRARDSCRPPTPLPMGLGLGGYGVLLIMKVRMPPRID